MKSKIYFLTVIVFISLINSGLAQKSDSYAKWHFHINSRFILNEKKLLPVRINYDENMITIMDDIPFFINIVGHFSYSIKPQVRVGVEYTQLGEINKFNAIAYPDYLRSNRKSQTVSLLSEYDYTLLGEKDKRHLNITGGLGILFSENKIVEKLGNDELEVQSYHNIIDYYGFGIQPRISLRFFINKYMSLSFSQQFEIIIPTQHEGFTATTSQGTSVSTGSYYFPFLYYSGMASYGIHF